MSYAFSIGIPFIIQSTIDSIVINKNKFYLDKMFAILIVFFVLLSSTIFIKDNYLSILKNKINKTINYKVFSHLLQLPYKFFDTREKSSILYSLNNINVIRDSLTEDIINGLINIGSLIFTLIYIYLNSKILAIISLFLISINILSIILARKLTVETTKKLLLEESKFQSIQNEIIQSILNIKMLTLETDFLNNWEQGLDNFSNQFFKKEKLNNSIKSIFTLLQNISPAIILYVSILLMLHGKMSIGSILAIYSLSANLFSVVNSISSTWIKYQNCKLILERLSDIVLHPIEKEVNFKIKHDIIGDIKLKNVYFSYSKNSDTVLKNINLDIKSGSKIGIVGKSGAGKSTFAKLLIGLYEPTSGEVLIDGINLKNIDKEYFRKQIGIIPQDPLLFNKTIYDNIAINSKNTSLEKVKEICKLTQIHQEIDSIPMGYYTPISEYGQNLSGGQRQRIILARTLLNNPKILIFDEATSFLDNINEKNISNWLKEKGCTRIIITHRLSIILDSDLIFVIDEGQVVGQGTHEDLLKENQLYKNLYLSDITEIN